MFREVSRLLGLSALILAAASSARAAVVLSYGFDETGTSAGAAGSAATAGDPRLNFFGNFGTPGVASADLHGAPGSGVSGQATDRSFNNTATSGFFGSGGSNAADFDPIDGLTSFTLSGWFKVPAGAAEAIGRQAPLFENGTISVLDDPAGFRLRGGAVADAGTLELRVDRDNSVESTRSYTEIGQFVNFAVSYDGTATSDNVKFYKGLIGQPVQLVTTATLNTGAVEGESIPLRIGATFTSGLTFASFAGEMDNFRIYDEVATLATLETARLADIGVPEPTSAMLVVIGAAALALLRRSNGTIA